MKSLICVAVAMLATMVSAKPHLETVFTIPLPGKVLTHPAPSEVLTGPNFYVSTAAGIVLANLSTQNVAWTANVTSSVNPQMGYAPAVSMFFQGSDLYACSSNGVYKLDAASGSQKWMFPLTSSLGFNAFKCNLTFTATEVAVILSNDIYILSRTAGTAKTHNYYPSGFIAGTIDGKATVFGQGNSGALTATDLFSGNTLWSFNSGSQFGFAPYYVVPGYLLCTNQTEQGLNVNLVVLNSNNGTLKVEVDAVSGITYSNFNPTIDGNLLTFVAGEQDQRKMTVDLNTGYIVKQVPYSGGNSEGPTGPSTYSVVASDINAEIRVTSTLALEVGPIGGPYTQAANFTPSAGSYNLQYYGQGVVQVGNLQGWTMWQVDASTKAATFLARNEMQPGWKASKGAPITYNGAFINILATEIRAEKIIF